jgi:hypothetical protein
MEYLPDIVLFSSRGDPLMVVEVKGAVGTTAAWASQLRRNLMVHSGIRPPKYFMLASPDHFFLWDASAQHRPDALPAYEIDAASLLSQYRLGTELSSEPLGHSALETVVGSWLQALIAQADAGNEPPPSQEWLTESGLFRDLKGGRIEYEVKV